jgi:hypothetical protein
MSIYNVEPVLAGTIGPNAVVYDYAIPNKLISGISLVSTPHVDFNGTVTYSHTDIESVSVIHNGVIVNTTVNYDRTSSLGVAPLYICQKQEISILPAHLFLNNLNINGTLVIRIIFWRNPLSQLWIQLTF